MAESTYPTEFLHDLYRQIQLMKTCPAIDSGHVELGNIPNGRLYFRFGPMPGFTRLASLARIPGRRFVRAGAMGDAFRVNRLGFLFRRFFLGGRFLCVIAKFSNQIFKQ